MVPAPPNDPAQTRKLHRKSQSSNSSRTLLPGRPHQGVGYTKRGTPELRPIRNLRQLSPRRDSCRLSPEELPLDICPGGSSSRHPEDLFRMQNNKRWRGRATAASSATRSLPRFSRTPAIRGNCIWVWSRFMAPDPRGPPSAQVLPLACGPPALRIGRLPLSLWDRGDGRARCPS